MNKLRHIKITPEEFFKWYEENVNSSDEHMTGEFEGMDILVNLLNYKVFKHKGIDCPVCKARGSFFALEKTPGRGRNKYNIWHFNLYAKDAFDRDVLMTKDHILARANGGTDDLTNLQPMCQGCNSRKGSVSMEVFQQRIGNSRTADWEMSQCNRVIFSAKKHYDISITPTDYLDLKNKVLNAPIIGKTDGIAHRELVYQGKKIIAVWDSMKNVLLDLESPSMRDAIQRMMPAKFQEHQDKADMLFDQIVALSKKEYEKIPVDERTVDRFKKCTYPTMIYDIHRGNEIGMGKIAKNIVISKLKKELRNEKRTSSI